MSKSVSIDQLGEAIANELTLYSRDVIDGVKKQAKKSRSKLVKDTKATAPVGHRKKHYKVELRECTSEDVIEIDTFRELKQIDKTYDV